jgi:uncharacterized membrane protein YheB (UPF0754 family)
MSEIKLILIPLFGAFIGYFTNYLAIKMLFRPFEEKRIFGVKIPFTPGLIPRERERIAENIAKTIKEHLLPEEKLLKMLEESGYQERVKNRVRIIIDELIDSASDDIKNIIKSGISIGKVNIKGFFIASALEKAVDKINERVKEKLKKDLYEKASDKVVKHIEEELPIMLSQIDIEKIVKDTFLEIDIEKLEEIILGFSGDELRYITYLGGVIGFIIGILQDILILLS